MLIELKLYQDQNIERRPTLKLSDWQYLKGVEDFLRVGGFRFKDTEAGIYLNVSENQQVPPMLSLEALYEAAQEVEKKELTQDRHNKWIERLFEPGTSVGGARPKACVTDGKDLYIAKFPSTFDTWNVGRWEYFANKMAELCGIRTAKTKILSLSPGHDIFLSKRFDRTPEGKRIHMGSASNLLGLTTETGPGRHHSYSDIADFIVSHGTHVEETLQELYRRVALTICIGNGDDHLKKPLFPVDKERMGAIARI